MTCFASIETGISGYASAEEDRIYMLPKEYDGADLTVGFPGGP